ncbi:monocarboxylate transporter 6 [Corythoichthys intestinalis]|uniref:monocarboxylate transporter 6 n=1 Tax=Corythoichthys intestinalis TaxID=161448 RepID=UPI0025A5B0E5|nr:monocarboxylate transporter 6 [Corythoichthys intestinalis]XP_057682585.1 monocarboxylate transporter 6 [Corythoichthys intestinalis]
MSGEENGRAGRHGRIGDRHGAAPEGGWGWVVLASTVAVLALTLAFPACVGIFYSDLQKDFQASNSQTSWVPAIMTAALHAGGPLCSVLVERAGCRATVMLGGVLSGLGVAAGSFARSVGQLYITAGAVAGLGFCFSYQPAVTILGQYFVERRAFANAVSSTGTALGLCALPALADFLRERFGWRGSFLVLGAVLFHCCVCGALMRPLWPPPPPAEPGTRRGFVACVAKHLALDQLLHNRRYAVYAAAITWTMLGFVVPLLYLVPYATAHGTEAGRAASLLSALGAVNVAARPPAGAVFGLRRFRGRHVYVFSAALLLNGLSNLVCCAGPAFPVLLSYALLYGLSMSAVGSLMFTVLMDTVDAGRFPSALGLLSVMESVTLLAGPPLAGLLLDATGDHRLIFAGCAAVVASAAVFLGVAFWRMDTEERARDCDDAAAEGRPLSEDSATVHSPMPREADRL